MPLGHLRHVESKFDSQVRCFVVGKCNRAAEAALQMGVDHRNRFVDAVPMAIVVGSVVRQRAQRKGVLIEVSCLRQQIQDEIAAADVMQQCAKERVPEWIVTDVLDDGATVRVGVRPAEVFRRGIGIALQQERNDTVLPRRVNDRLVCKDRITGSRWGYAQTEQQWSKARSVTLSHNGCTPLVATVLRDSRLQVHVKGHSRSHVTEYANSGWLV